MSSRPLTEQLSAKAGRIQDLSYLANDILITPYDNADNEPANRFWNREKELKAIFNAMLVDRVVVNQQQSRAFGDAFPSRVKAFQPSLVEAREEGDAPLLIYPYQSESAVAPDTHRGVMVMPPDLKDEDLEWKKGGFGYAVTTTESGMPDLKTAILKGRQDPQTLVYPRDPRRGQPINPSYSERDFVDQEKFIELTEELVILGGLALPSEALPDIEQAP